MTQHTEHAEPDALPLPPPVPVSFGEAFRFWLKLGFISFGGPAGQIAIMHQELVERRRWISERRFLHALNYCMVLPGPKDSRDYKSGVWTLPPSFADKEVDRAKYVAIGESDRMTLRFVKPTAR